jgi:hypothetical protein
VIQERSQERRVQVLQSQPGRYFGQLFLGKLEQKTKRISVSGYGMVAGSTLSDEPAREERFQQGREAGLVSD